MTSDLQEQTNPLILNKPHLVAPLTKVVSALITVVFWGFFVYLWWPLITLVAGMLGYHTINELTYAADMLNVRHLTISYALIVMALSGSLLLWAAVEYFRFRNLNRRRWPNAVAVADLATYSSLPESDLQQLQSERRMVAHHDDHGGVMQFDGAQQEKAAAGGKTVDFALHARLLGHPT